MHNRVLVMRDQALFALRRWALVVWAVAAPAVVVAGPMGYDEARHLLNRTGFGATHGEVTEFAARSREEAVDTLLRTARASSVARHSPPRWTDEPITPLARLRAMTPEERMAENRVNIARAFELREWWIREMLTTPVPLVERMTLFWHGHFAVSQRKVRHSQLMYRQNVTLRRHALGNFGALLQDIARDPAMLIYLDGAQNRRESPNENFAREVMELFTLGEGHYSERDVKEAARAFTGWSIEREGRANFVFRPRLHDPGIKTVLGVSEAMDGQRVLEILLARPETATFITRKLWREFISPNPDEAEVARLARIFRDGKYELAPLLRAMLTSPSFYAADNRAVLVKSPVDLVVGTLRTFAVEVNDDLRPAVLALALLGQNLLAPPNVKGWPGGEHWINSATLLGRKQMAERLFRGEDRSPQAMVERMEAMLGEGAMIGRERRFSRQMERGMEGWRVDAGRWMAQFGDELESREKGSLALALALPPVRLPAGSLQPIDWVRALTTDPVYQLK